MAEMRRVVVTGVGAVTPVGNTAEEFWAALIQGKSGIGPVTRFDASPLPTRIAGELKGFDPLRYIDKKDDRKLDPFLKYAIACAAMAVEDAGLNVERVDRTRFGVLVGSGIGGITTLLETHKVLLEKGPDRVSPFFIPMLIINMASGLISMRFGAKGPNSSVVTACATGNHAIGDAMRIIQRNDADVMIAGGSEAIILPLTFAGFCQMKAMSTRNDDPGRASRPFDAARDGFVCGEGGGLLVLESLDHALARDARIYAEVVGYGMTGDAHHMTAPDPEADGAARAMSLALRDAGVEAVLGGLHQRPRHVDPLQRQVGDHGHQAGVRRPRAQARGVVHQVDDRAPAGRRGRHRGHRHRVRDPPRDPAAHHQLRDAGSRTATSTTSPTRPASRTWRSRSATRSASGAPTPPSSSGSIVPS